MIFSCRAQKTLRTGDRNRTTTVKNTSIIARSSLLAGRLALWLNVPPPNHILLIFAVLGHHILPLPGPDGRELHFRGSTFLNCAEAKGFADVWKRGYFAWEYKGKHRDLEAAYVS